jgi:predicted nuclease of predicted toxin-antitoxin system
LKLLKVFAWELIAPQGVYHEAVEEGLAEGYPDAGDIAKFFERGYVKVCKAGEGPKRDVDREVLKLAQEEEAILCSDDRGLLRRAMRLGLKTLRSPDLLLMLWREGSLEAEQYRLLLHQLEAEKRIDRATRQRYLKLER